MYVQQLYTGCLAQAAYYIESNGEAAVIDPLREPEPYLELAKSRGAKIKYIFETHFHADFVSGHVDLAGKTGATIVYGPTAKTSYDMLVAKDGEVFHLGNISFTVLHTPGHTPESSTFLLKDESGKDYAIFTGDTLFIGDVGRPDLALGGDLTKEDLAGMLYDSLHNKIVPLADDVIVYPAHGAGSACGKNMSKETYDMLGQQKQFNYALQAKSREQFIKEVTEGIAPPPQYFPKNAAMNQSGYETLDEVKKHGLTALSAQQVKTHLSEGALLLDTRTPDDFAKGFVPGSLFIGVNGSFATWVGTLIPNIMRPIVIIADAGQEDEVVTRLSRVGYDNTRGYLQGGIEAWKEAGYEVKTIESINIQEFSERFGDGNVNVVDVRKPSEFDTRHVDGAQNMPLDTIQETYSELQKDKQYHVHCQGGYRSMMAISILNAAGYDKLVNVEKGFGGISKETDVPTVSAVHS
jgi:glyoxylase-like metal-dependent hydrolase (beta-lactamase superfamily II)/rhodanese-related sulfurtransferase